MAIVSSNSATAYGLGQLQLQQARRNADQAEFAAQALQAQARQARRDADVAEEKASTLAVQSSQAQSRATSARQGMALAQSNQQMQTVLGRMAENIRPVQRSGGAQAAPTKAEPVVNTQGQVTGRVVNTTA